jgi:class 3 adenylate cyclase
MSVLTERQIQAIDRFPDQNPHPVMRFKPDGELTYANESSAPVLAALGRIAVGDRLAPKMLDRLVAIAGNRALPTVEVQDEDRTYALLPVFVADLGFYNLYGTDVTAEKAIARFPDSNPNPVMRVAPDWTLSYANAASGTIVAELGLEVGRPLPDELVGRLKSVLADSSAGPVEIEAGALTYELWPVEVHGFDFINVYGTDVTAAREVARLNEQNAALLLNILPSPIADRLRAGETIIADRHDDVTLLFADIVGFTTLSNELTPNELVTMLNEIFGMTDELADDLGLEKIKTIGDAYLVAGGLNEKQADHTERVARMALRMVAGIESLAGELGKPVHCRFGIHCGPAVAGVIGKTKWIYDVWGDTVNMASRMESYGEPGRIHCSHAVYERLAGSFRFESRGLVEIKGKGPLPTYFLLGPINTGRPAG